MININRKSEEIYQIIKSYIIKHSIYNPQVLKNVIDISERYEHENKRINSLDDENYIHDGNKPEFME